MPGYHYKVNITQESVRDVKAVPSKVNEDISRRDISYVEGKTSSSKYSSDKSNQFNVNMYCHVVKL